MRVPGAALLALVFLAAAPAAASAGPAEQPPFGGEPVPPLVERQGGEPPPGFALAAEEVRRLADAEPAVERLAGGPPEGAPAVATLGTRGEGLWEVRYRRPGEREILAIVVVDDEAGEVIDVFTDEEIETKLARGYEDAVAGDLNEAWFWLPLCLLFCAPFFDPRRPLRLLHLDLLALLGFSASLFFFNRAEIELSTALVYPVLAYLFARMLVAGFRPRESREPLLPWAPRSWLVAGALALAALHAGYAIDQGRVIDVGLAGVIGADRLADGEDVYGDDFSEGLPASGDVRGDVYGPVNYLAYAPFEQAMPWSGEWDDVPAARGAALGFSLITALLLFALGRRLRAGEEGRTLGAALAFAWLAYPFTLYTLGSSFNDSLVALVVVASLLVLSSPPARGAMAALAGLTKFGPLALVPLLAAGTGDRRPRTLALFALAFAAVAALVTLPLLPDGGLRELYDRSLGYQASRGSPFSVWGQAPDLEPLQTASKLFAVALGALVFFIPRQRSVVQVAALGAAVLIAVQVTASHWFYPYAVWFAPLVLIAAFATQRGPEPQGS